MSQPSHRREGDLYRVSPEEKKSFERDGFVHLRGVLSDDELREIAEVYQRFLLREISVKGRDYCDMSGDYTRDPQDFEIINVMLPRHYHTAWQGNPYERRAASIALQLCGPDMVIDYDQLLAKKPQKQDAVFSWHQDAAYWPETQDPRTATCWLALDPSTRESGCMRFIPGSHLEPTLREHRPLHGDRENSHTLIADVDETQDQVQYVEIEPGDITVHNERVAHGSGGNTSNHWRRAYVLAFRSKTTVEEERRRGFTHSHNDDIDVLKKVSDEG